MKCRISSGSVLFAVTKSIFRVRNTIFYLEVIAKLTLRYQEKRFSSVINFIQTTKNASTDYKNDNCIVTIEWFRGVRVYLV